MPAVIMPSSTQQNGGSAAKNPDDLFAIFDSAPSTELDTSTENTTSTKHSHRKTSSLVGFDPMLDSLEQTKPSHTSSGSQVWSNDDVSSLHHPLLAPSKTTTSKPSAHRTSKSVCVSELQDIASQLSLDKPRALTSEEERRITLGDSTKDSITKHDRKLLKKKSNHRKSQSVSDIVGLRPKATPPVTPETRGKALVKKTASPTNTPPRSATSTPIQSPKLFRNSITSKLSPPRPKTAIASKEAVQIPTLMKQSPTSFLKDAAAMAPRSSEQEPSPHQVEIPSSEELLVHVKLCALLDSYIAMDQNFDFNILKGADTLTMHGFVKLDSMNHSIAGLTTEQKPIVQALLGCGSDICVEGFFASGEDNTGLQVGVFSQQNTFIVVYRGTTEQQMKPTRGGKMNPVNLDSENAVAVYPPFRDAYFELETQVYGLLDTLVEENPFSNVIFVGQSFGGALATIGAVRFAVARPVLRFACHAFGSPKVGTQEWRQMVNTLSNLKVMRVEYGHDANTVTPSDSKWEHVGHSLAIHSSVGSGNSKISSHPILAYRFDHKKPSVNRLQIRKSTDAQAYVRALEPFASHELKWCALYVGEDVGEGVRGENDEKRLMV